MKRIVVGKGNGSAEGGPPPRTGWQWSVDRRVALICAAVAAVLLVMVQPPRAPRCSRAGATATGQERDLPPCNLTLLSGLLENDSFAWVGEASAVPDPARGAWETQLLDPQLRLKRCRLRRPSPEEARACLAGRPVVMMGDSLTRYLFLSLNSYLEGLGWAGMGGSAQGKGADRGTGDSGSRGSSSGSSSDSIGSSSSSSGNPGRSSALPRNPLDIINEHSWGNWSAFLAGTTAIFGGAQLCDCGRTGGPWFENRHYRRGQVSLHYFWQPGPRNLSGHNGFPPFGDTPPCAPGACLARADWEFPMAEAMEALVARLGAKSLILNYGLWGVFHEHARLLGTLPPQPDAFAAAARRAANRTVDADMVALAQRHGWDLLDAWALTQPLHYMRPRPYLDHVHVAGWVYRELNFVLLNMLC
eukprot:scaffold13.g349.t1